MGLDMYAYKVPKEFAKGDFEIDDAYTVQEDDELTYWRKHHDLHGWFYYLYKQKGGKGTMDDFNCVPVRLTLEDLEKLKFIIKNRKLPHTTGFLFGNFPPNDESDKHDLKFIKKARKAIKDGYEVYYDSWW